MPQILPDIPDKKRNQDFACITLSISFIIQWKLVASADISMNRVYGVCKRHGLMAQKFCEGFLSLVRFFSTKYNKSSQI
jgi:hypothetical protein